MSINKKKKSFSVGLMTFWNSVWGVILLLIAFLTILYAPYPNGILGFALIPFSIACFILARGTWNLRKWAWYINMAIQLIVLITNIVAIVLSLTNFATLGVSIFWSWFVYSRRKYFRQDEP